MKRFIIFIFMVLGMQVVMAQPQNLDFETWDSSSFALPYPRYWNSLQGQPDAQVTNAQNGNYAIQISVWYYYVKTVAMQMAPINYKPSALDGYYSYTGNIQAIHRTVQNDTVNDTARVCVYLTAWNTAQLKRDTIGQGITILDSTSHYKAFSCPVQYLNPNVTPDSIIIYFSPSIIRGINGMGTLGNTTNPQGYCSYMTIDNLSLQSQATGIAESADQKGIQLFPNPVSDAFTLQFDNADARTVQVYDMYGKLLTTLDTKDIKLTIPAAGLQPGVYQVSVQDRFHRTIHDLKFVKQ